MKKLLYLFRHGQTDFNIDKSMKYSEKTVDMCLNSNGFKQAETNADSLQNKHIEIVYSSPAKRVLQTADALVKRIGVNVIIDDELREFSTWNSSLFGYSRAEIAKIVDNSLLDRISENRDDLMDYRSLNTCETKREARNRIYSAVLRICQASEFKVIGIGSHNAILREFLRACNFGDDSRVENCEIIEASYDDKFNKIQIIKRIKN